VGGIGIMSLRARGSRPIPGKWSAAAFDYRATPEPPKSRVSVRECLHVLRVPSRKTGLTYWLRLTM